MFARLITLCLLGVDLGGCAYMGQFFDAPAVQSPTSPTRGYQFSNPARRGDREKPRVSKPRENIFDYTCDAEIMPRPEGCE